jgi:hypothetical protein
MGLLYEDRKWLVVDKPAGISTHGSFPGDVAMQEWMQLHWNRSTFVCSRLDKGTSGALLFALSAEASGHAQKIHESHQSVKEYLFLSSRRSDRGSWVDETPLDGLPARTEFRRLDPVGQWTRYRAILSRGRTHQIRRHARHSGIPVLGDEDYGGEPARRLYLHCLRISWPGIDREIVASVPAGFEEPETPRTCLDRRLDYPASIADGYRLVDEGEDPRGPIDLYGSRGVGDPSLVKELGMERASSAARVREHGLAISGRLDLRDLRRRIFLGARGRRVANLSGVASLAVAAAAGGAEVVFTVGKRAPGKADFAANGLGRGKFVDGSPLKWLARQRAKPRIDLVLCASASEEIARAVREILAPGGTAVFLSGEAEGLRRVYPVVERHSPTLDFPLSGARVLVSHSSPSETRQPFLQGLSRF